MTTFTFSMVSFILSEVNSSLSTLWSSPASSLRKKIILVIQQGMILKLFSAIQGKLLVACQKIRSHVKYQKKSIKAKYFHQDLPPELFKMSTIQSKRTYINEFQNLSTKLLSQSLDTSLDTSLHILISFRYLFRYIKLVDIRLGLLSTNLSIFLFTC